MEDSFEIVKNELGERIKKLVFGMGWYCYVSLVMLVFVMMAICEVWR